jgi:hypothetical protein
VSIDSIGLQKFDDYRVRLTLGFTAWRKGIGENQEMWITLGLFSQPAWLLTSKWSLKIEKVV